MIKRILFALSSLCFVKAMIEYKTDAKKNPYLVDCVNNLLKNIYTQNKLILLSSDFITLKFPCVKYNSLKHVTIFSAFKMDIGIIHIEEHTEFAQVVQAMSMEQFFNPTAKFVLITKNVSQEFLQVSSHFYLKDVIFIKPINQSFQNIYTYQLFQNQNSSFTPDNFKYLANCKNGTPSTSKVFGNYNVPKFWKNSTVNVVYNVIAPYFQCPGCENSLEDNLLDIVSKKLGFKVNYVAQEDFNYWGSKINGSYTYRLGKLYQRECDMVVGAFHSKFEEHLDFDVTFTFMEDGLFWLVPKAAILSGWRLLALVFSWQSYLALVLTMLAVPFIYRLFYKKSAFDYFLVFYQTLLETALPRLPRQRLLYSHILVPFLTISTLFRASLIHVLSIDHHRHQINSLEDIVRSNLTITIDHDIARYFKNEDPLEKYVYESYEYCEKPRQCINRTAYINDVVTVDFQRSHELNLPSLYVDAKGKPLVHLFDNPIFPLYMHWYFIKGHPIFPQINDVILKLKSCGIIQYLIDKISFKAKVDLSRKVGITSNILGLREIGVALVLLIVGCFFGLIAFIVEVCIAYCKKEKCIMCI